MYGELVPLDGGDPIPLSGRRMRVGRREHCDIVLDARDVSARHASLRVIDDRWHVVDQKSKNGVFVNGKQVSRRQLEPGDVVAFGRHEFVFEQSQRVIAEELSSRLVGFLEVVETGKRPGEKSGRHQARPYHARPRTTNATASRAHDAHERQERTFTIIASAAVGFLLLMAIAIWAYRSGQTKQIATGRVGPVQNAIPAAGRPASGPRGSHDTFTEAAKKAASETKPDGRQGTKPRATKEPSAGTAKKSPARIPVTPKPSPPAPRPSATTKTGPSSQPVESAGTTTKVPSDQTAPAPQKQRLASETKTPAVAPSAATPKPVRPPAEPGPRPQSSADSAKPASPAATTTPVPNESASRTTRRPIPSPIAQQEMLRQFAEVYDFDEQRTPQQRVEFAQRIFTLGKESQGSPAERYVAFQKAIELAHSGGDAALTIEIIEAVSDEFVVDPLKTKHRMLIDFAESDARDETQIASFVGAVDQVIDQAMAAGHYVAAQELADAAYRLSLQNAGREFRKEIYNRRKEVRELAERFSALGDARATLASDPGDADAALVVGRWLCMEREDWASGLPLLARSSSPALSAAARSELSTAPKDAVAKMKLADAWWDLAQKAGIYEKPALMKHAGQWYGQALPGIASGIAKAKVESRLAEINAIDEIPTDLEPEPPVEKGDDEPVVPES